MKQKLSEIYKGLLGSLDNKRNNGFSARKLTSLTVMLCVVAAHFKWIMLGNFHQLEAVLIIDYGFVASLLGMTTYQNMKSSKRADDNKQTNIEIKNDNEN